MTQETRLRSTEPRVPLGKVFGILVAFEAVWVLLRSISVLSRFQPDYTLWPLTLAASFLWPLVFIGAAYVLLRPKFPGSAKEAVLRSGLVWVVMLVNLALVAALLSRPEMVLRSPL